MIKYVTKFLKNSMLNMDILPTVYRYLAYNIVQNVLDINIPNIKL